MKIQVTMGIVSLATLALQSSECEVMRLHRVLLDWWDVGEVAQRGRLWLYGDDRAKWRNKPHHHIPHCKKWGWRGPSHDGTAVGAIQGAKGWGHNREWAGSDGSVRGEDKL